MSTPYEALEKLFHEPSRLAIMSELCGAENGLSFNALKDSCSLTDGNLSRHLSTLCEAKAVRIEKQFIDSKPRTTVFVTDSGRNQFLDYLDALEKVLKEASAKAREKTAEARKRRSPKVSTVLKTSKA